MQKINNINENKKVSSIIKVQPKETPKGGNNVWNLVIAQNLLQQVLGKDMQLTIATSEKLLDKQLEAGGVEKEMAKDYCDRSSAIGKLSDNAAMWSSAANWAMGVGGGLMILSMMVPELAPIAGSTAFALVAVGGVCQIMNGTYQVKLAKIQMKIALLTENTRKLQAGNEYMNNSWNNSNKKLSGSMKTRQDLRGQEFKFIKQMGQSESNISRKVS